MAGQLVKQAAGFLRRTFRLFGTLALPLPFFLTFSPVLRLWRTAEGLLVSWISPRWVRMAFLIALLALAIAVLQWVLISLYPKGYIAGADGGCLDASCVVWPSLPSPTIFATASALSGALVYVLLRVRQVGRDIASDDLAWPDKVADSFTQVSGVVLGNGGTGKTTLLDFLYQRNVRAQRIFQRGTADLGGEGMVNAFYDRVMPTIGGAIRDYRVTGLSKKVRVGYERDLWDVPGQAWLMRMADPANAWTERIREALRADHALIVNVMTYGYAASIRSGETYAHWTKDGVFDDEGFRQRIRSLEREALTFAVDRICEAPRAAAGVTFVNLVNMAGFWWDRNREVQAYHEEEMRRQNAKLGGRLFSYDGGAFSAGRSEISIYPYVPASLLFDDMTSKGSDGCRTQVFCAREPHRRVLTQITAHNVRWMEALLYGKVRKPVCGVSDV